MTTFVPAMERQTFGESTINPLHTGFLLSFAFTALTLVLGAYLWGAGGAAVVVVGMGWPHVVLGFLFYARRLVRDAGPARLNFSALLLATVAISFAHSLSDITTVIYVYFVYHALRDEIFIYHQRRTDHRYRGRVFDRGGLALLISTTLLAGVSQLQNKIPAWIFPKSLAAVPHSFELVLCGLALLLATLSVFRIPRSIFGQRPAFRSALSAMFLFIAAMTGMKVARSNNIPLPLFFSFLVVFHYFSWYVFNLEKIKLRQGKTLSHKSPQGFDRFLQIVGTRNGFLVFTLAMNAISFAGVFSYLLLKDSHWLGYAFSLKYFLYILVFHVTVSFAPKPVAPAATAA